MKLSTPMGYRVRYKYIAFDAFTSLYAGLPFLQQPNIVNAYQQHTSEN